VPQPADPEHTAKSAEPTDADQAADIEDAGAPARGNPWDTFRFRRFGGLERTAPITPEPDTLE
jgi:hypothetical protein